MSTTKKLAVNFATSIAGAVDSGDIFATGINDTGGKFATGVNVSTTLVANNCSKYQTAYTFKVNLKEKMYHYVN